jgi:hypothetical protein
MKEKRILNEIEKSKKVHNYIIESKYQSGKLIKKLSK